VRTDFAAAGDWLTRLHGTGGNGQASVADMLEGVPEVLGRRFCGQPGTDADLADLAALRARLAGHSTPQSVVHGDFWLGNLLVAEGRVRGVVDWEHARLTGSPVRDLARFATSYALYLDRHTRPGRQVAGHRGLRAGPWGAGVEYAIDGAGWFPDLVRSFVMSGLKRLGASPSCWRDVLLADLATTAATADQHEFALNHLLLFRHLTGGRS
jgi:hypothetical protein